MPELTEIELDLFAADLEQEEGEDAETAWLEAASEEYTLPFDLPEIALTPRPYQKDALSAWGQAHGRGVVVLPTPPDKKIDELNIK